MTTRPDKPQSVYALVGADRFIRREALSSLLRTLDDGTGLFDPSRFDGASAALADVLDEVRSMSLLGGLRVVIVDEADAFIKTHRAALERYAGEALESGCLILLCNAMAKNTRLYKIIHSHGVVMDCAPPKPRDMPGWLVARARTAYGKRLPANAASSLVSKLGIDPGILNAELSKLATFVRERPDIQMSDIEALTGCHREEKIFAVMDAMSEGKVSEALQHWRQVLQTDRAAPARAIAGLAWAVRSQVQAHHQWKEGASIERLAFAAYTTPEKLRRRLESTSLKDLENRQNDLLSAELACKSGASTVETAIEKFIVTHCLQGATARH